MTVGLALVGQAMAPPAGQAAPHPEECPATPLAPGAEDEHHSRVRKECACGATLEIDQGGPRDRGAAPPGCRSNLSNSETPRVIQAKGIDTRIENGTVYVSRKSLGLPCIFSLDRC
jgi:hypothetical protein